MKLRVHLPEQDEGLDLTPMIDCVFLLLLFFMMTSTFVDELQGLEITLPKADKAKEISAKDADTISIAADGRFYWHLSKGKTEQIEDLTRLMDKLKINKNRAQRPVILRGDARCEYRFIVQVKNALKLAGVETIFEEVEVSHAKRKP